jgi:galactokinase
MQSGSCLPVDEALKTLTDSLERQLFEHYGKRPGWIAVAPGRVNLIGDHTDYSGGLALPMAIDRYTVALAAPRGDSGDFHRIYSAQRGELVLPSRESTVPCGDWSDYLRGVLAQYLERGIVAAAMDIVIGGNLPIGAGLSSSASLELCFAALLEAASEQQLNPLERALLCQRAEHSYAGVPCGILDQFTISFAEAGSAMLLDCHSRETTPIVLPPDIAIAIVDSGVSHALGDGGYAQRRREVETAEALLGKSLRDCRESDVQAIADPQVASRARHVISENLRVEGFAKSISDGDMQTAGELMYSSHRSLAQDFCVSCDELDTLVAAAKAAGALGARMTGGGFGGSMVCLLDADNTDRFAQTISQHYRQAGYGEAITRWVSPVAAASARSYP